jgi:hypothetical protein
MTPFSVVVGYQRFGGSCCLHLQSEDGSFFRINIKLRHNPEDPDLNLDMNLRENLKPRKRKAEVWERE